MLKPPLSTRATTAPRRATAHTTATVGMPRSSGWSEQEFFVDGTERRSWLGGPTWLDEGPDTQGPRSSSSYPPEEPAAALPNPPNPPNPPTVTPAWVADTVAAATVPSAPFVP